MFIVKTLTGASGCRPDKLMSRMFCGCILKKSPWIFNKATFF